MRLFPTVPGLRMLGGELALDSVVFIGLLWYFKVGLRRAYQPSKKRLAISAVVLAITVPVTIVAYHSVLFYLAFWTT